MSEPSTWRKLVGNWRSVLQHVPCRTSEPSTWRKLGGNWRSVLQHVPCFISHILPGKGWQQTSYEADGRVCCYWPRPPTSYTVCWQLVATQRTRRLADVTWRVMTQAFDWTGRLGGSASMSDMGGLQTQRLRTDADPQKFLRFADWYGWLLHKNSRTRTHSDPSKNYNFGQVCECYLTHSIVSARHADTTDY